MTSGGNIAQAVLCGKRVEVKMWREAITAYIFVYGKTVVWELSYRTTGPEADEIREELKDFESLQIRSFDDWCDGMTYARFKHDDSVYSGGVDIGRWERIEGIYRSDAATAA